ncbi:molybdopterin-binding protein [Paenibacillus turpanensis]|uniref:molybdopterin-binding protein n=1 Tax=Paenibacillus turpanensis TaxID=2689078 RepID=UPI00140CDFB9|nr:molybdopterin-binding protein [Paenibacillus turpanensis]
MSDSPMLREVRVQEAIGMMLAHDLTQIIPGQFKGRKFKKGHIIREEDIPGLLDIGKEHIYVMDLQQGWLHEEEAALRMAKAAAGQGVLLSEPHEGKVSLKASGFGLAKISRPFVEAANAIDGIVFSTIKNDTIVQAGQQLAGTRVVPLVIEAERIEAVEKLALEEIERQGGVALVEVKPFRKLRVGLITTGSEVFKGRIQDKFGPAVRSKVEALGSEVVEQRFAPDESDEIVKHIHAFQQEGVDLILLTGGMSVDPDDRTPGAIRKSGAEVVSYGTPMLPGSMLMMAYLDGIPVMGLPGCVMHDPFTSFDVLLPRICAGETIVREDITAMGYGGLLGC